MTRILHISDTHGRFDPLPNNSIHNPTFDVIVHSGDFLPNRTRGILAIEPGFQSAWLSGQVEALQKWLIRGRKHVPFLFVQGNHDFINPCPLMQDMGIDARNITGTVEAIGGIKFFGFADVPYFTGEWANEYSEDMITGRFAPVVDMLNNCEIDVLVTHAPLYGFLDQNARGERCGSTAIRHAFVDKILNYPKALLHGHIHESNGMTRMYCKTNQLLISNAATTQRIIELSARIKRLK